MTDVYIAFSMSGEARHTFSQLDWDEQRINLLVSYYYLHQFERLDEQHPVNPPRRMLDSGAYSAYKSGKTIDIESLIGETKRERWQESVSLDVIGDPEASLRNALYMKAAGSPAYPVFHFGEPWDLLKEYSTQFEKVGLSCRFGEGRTDSISWLEQCFARAWPKKFHSFGWIDERMLMTFPFHSADTASWNNGPSCFGRWKSFRQMSVRGIKDLRAEIDVYLKLQDRLKQRWAGEMSRWIS